MTSQAETPPPPAPAPGIDGVILVSPSRPGPITKDAPNAAPAGNLTFDVLKGDQKVATFTTDTEGHFHVAVPPGHYVISRGDPGASVGHWQFEVDVTAAETAKVHWTGDSGMR